MIVTLLAFLLISRLTNICSKSRYKNTASNFSFLKFIFTSSKIFLNASISSFSSFEIFSVMFRFKA